MKFPDKIYNILKWVSIIAIPASATLVKVVFPIWHIPFAEEISTTIVAVGAFLGALIGVSTATYNKEQKDESENN